MVQQRLPIVNSDDGAWGDLLNQYLKKEHYDTGVDNPANGGHQNITIRSGANGAGTAPLKFTSGPLMSAPEVGAVEFFTDAYYGTISTGTARKTFAFLESPVFTGTVTIPILKPATDSTTAIKVNKADGTTNVLSIDTSNGRLGIGATPAEALDVYGNVRIGNTGTGSTGTIRAEKELVLRQDGDTYGPSILRMRNRNGENGAIFETTDATATLVDFIFKSSVNQRNIRYESRATARAGTPAFHIGGLSPDNPTLAVGDSYAAVVNKLAIGSYTLPTAYLGIAAGTIAAGTAPLKFKSGPLMTAPEVGAIEFLTDRLYFTQTTNTTRKVVATYDDSAGATGDMYYRDSNAQIVRLSVGSDNNVLKVSSGLPAWAPPTSGGFSVNTIGVTIDGGGSVITTGSKGFKYIQENCTITGWTLIGKESGSCVIDVRKCNYAGFPTTISIAGFEKPTLVSVQNSQNQTLTAWTTSLSTGDIIEFVVNSVSTITRVSLFINISK